MQEAAAQMQERAHRIPQRPPDSAAATRDTHLPAPWLLQFASRLLQFRTTGASHDVGPHSTWATTRRALRPTADSATRRRGVHHQGLGS